VNATIKENAIKPMLNSFEQLRSLTAGKRGCRVQKDLKHEGIVIDAKKKVLKGNQHGVL